MPGQTITQSENSKFVGTVNTEDEMQKKGYSLVGKIDKDNYRFDKGVREIVICQSAGKDLTNEDIYRVIRYYDLKTSFMRSTLG